MTPTNRISIKGSYQSVIHQAIREHRSPRICSSSISQTRSDDSAALIPSDSPVVPFRPMILEPRHGVTLLFQLLAAIPDRHSTSRRGIATHLSLAPSRPQSLVLSPPSETNRSNFGAQRWN